MPLGVSAPAKGPTFSPAKDLDSVQNRARLPRRDRVGSAEGGPRAPELAMEAAVNILVS